MKDPGRTGVVVSVSLLIKKCIASNEMESKNFAPASLDPCRYARCTGMIIYCEKLDKNCAIMEFLNFL